MSQRALTIFCSAKTVPETFLVPAIQVAEVFASAGWELVWGGSNTGLMKEVADVFDRAGASLTGITIEKLQSVARTENTKLIVADDLNQRKDNLCTYSDAILALPGGVGTLDEITHAMELKKHGVLATPIYVLNADGYFDGLQQQYSQMSSQKLATPDLIQFVRSAEEVKGLLAQG